MLVCSVLTSCIVLSKITDSVLRLDVVNLAGFSCDCFFQSTRSTMVNRNGGMEHSILPEAEYLIGTKSLYFFNLKKFFILHCILLLPSIFFLSQQHKVPTYPQTAFFNTPMQNGLGNQSEVLHAIWRTMRLKGDFCC